MRNPRVAETSPTPSSPLLYNSVQRDRRQSTLAPFSLTFPFPSPHNLAPLTRPIIMFSSQSLLHRKNAFTLIELLTVIAIIGILAAIIIPATSKVRGTARAAQCASNLRQIGFGIPLYSQENKGAYPGPLYSGQGPAFVSGNGGSTGSLSLALEPYLQGKATTGLNKVSEMLDCSAWRAETPDNTQPSMILNITPRGWVTSGPTIRPFGDANIAGSKPMNVGSLSTYPLSTTWMLADVDQVWFQGSGAVPAWLARIPTRSVHGEARRNVLFFDGHVGSTTGGPRPATW